MPEGVKILPVAASLSEIAQQTEHQDPWPFGTRLYGRDRLDVPRVLHERDERDSQEHEVCPSAKSFTGLLIAHLWSRQLQHPSAEVLYAVLG
jgi:hypothetical protein